MKKLLTTTLMALTGATAVFSAAPEGATRVMRVPTVPGDGTVLYGEVTFSNSMNTTDGSGLAWGLYSFPAQSPMTVTPLHIDNTLCANGGGAYRKGKLYYTSYYEDMTGALGFLYLIEMDLQTYGIERHALINDTYDAISVDMAYDPVGDKIYGVSFDKSDNTLSTYNLVDFNLETGYPTRIASIARMSAIACDNLGQLWGIRYSDGKLVKINKMNAEVTEVGPTGINPIYNGSACFDYRTGKLYWSTNERNSEESGLYEVNTTTGAASLIAMYPDNESVAALYIPQADDICNLSPVTDLTANFSGSSLDGSISFTAPSTTVDGNAISGNVTVTGYIDGTMNFSIPVAPGASATRDLSLTQGQHTVELIATHPTGGKSERTSLTFYVGSDGPEAVTNPTATLTDGNKVKITWQAPTTGEHGGTINPALVWYKITRLPDYKVVSEEATGEEYTDVLPAGSEMRKYSYMITGYYRNLEGGSATTGDVEAGSPAALPFSESFDSRSGYDRFVARDNNRQEGYTGDNGMWGYNTDRQCAAYKYHTLIPADDWLITPGFALQKGHSYRLGFKTMASRYTPETLEVKIGRGYAPESFTQTLMPRTDLTSPNLTFDDHSIEFSVSEDGNYYIGFHAMTAKGAYTLYLDDVTLEEGASMDAPAVITDFKAVPGAQAGQVDISFTAPDKDSHGATLTNLTDVKISRGGNVVKTLTAAEGLAPGKKMTFTDSNVPTGKASYSVTSSNGAGESHASVTTVYAGLDTPVAVTAVTHTSADGVKAQLSWETPALGINGGSVAYEPLKYRITDNTGRTVAEAVAATSYTDDAIDTSAGQKSLIYTVTPYNAAGRGEGTESDFVTYGQAFRDGFAESFAGGQAPANSGWIPRILVESPYDNGFYGRYFAFSHNPNDKDRGPKPEAHDKDGGMLVAYTDFIDVESRMISPKINVSGLANPVLSFWFYHYYNPDTENGYSTEKEYMNVEALVDGEYKMLTANPILLINGTGWYRYDIPLKEAVGAKDFQIAFRTHNYISYDMHVDEITVRDTPDNDLRVESFSIPALISVNSTRNATVEIFNNGILPASDYTVELLRDGEVVATQKPEGELAFGKTATYKFPVTPTVAEAGKVYNYSARIVFAADADPSNNTSEAVEVQFPGNNLPTVTGLRGTVKDGNVELNWNEAESTMAGKVTEGFEAYEAFTITDFGEWSLFDNDGSLTYTISNSDTGSGDYEYPNAGYQMAFQIFNPRAIDMKGNLWTPYLGEQMAVCFAAAERSNDDWLISPEVKGGTTVSFMAKTVVEAYGLDKFYFCYSNGDEINIADFKRIGGVNVVPASDWTRYEFTLPEDARYFAINCVSENTYGFLLDEITYEKANSEVLEFRGYNVYRNGVKINAGTVEDNFFTDTAADPVKDNVYNVTALFDKGESGFSPDLLINFTGIDGITAGRATIRGAQGYVEILNADSRVTIVNAAGMKFFDNEVGDYARIPLQPGVYFVQAGADTVKLIVK